MRHTAVGGVGRRTVAVARHRVLVVEGARYYKSRVHVPTGMVIPGYDPADLDDHLADRLRGRDLSEWMTDEQIERYESGESLVELLSARDIDRLLEVDPMEMEG